MTPSSRSWKIALLSLLLISWVAGVAYAEDPASPSDPVIDLPTLTVMDSKILPPPESWRYARIDGFEVLSNASDRTAARLINDFQRFHQALVIAWPAADVKTGVPASLILCGRGDKFAAFKPVKDTGADSGLISMSLRDGEMSAIVVDLETKILNLVTPDSFPPPPPAGPTDEGDVGPVGPPEFSVDHYKQLYREYIHFTMARIEPRAPAWLEEGLAQIFMRMEFTSKWIIVGRIENPNEQSLGGQLEDRDFNVMLHRRALMPLSEMFAVAHDSPVALHPVGSAWAKQCYAFVHYCLYGFSGHLQKQFLTFVSRAAKEPITEAMFKECFNQSSSSLLADLRGYIETTQYQSTEFKPHKGESWPDLPKVEFRDATPAEVGRIKGETLRMAGNKAAARDTLIAPYIRGERDPQLLASLGLYEGETGDQVRARKFLEAAATAKVVRPRAYLSLARLRYSDALAAPGGPDGKLSSAQVVNVLLPLFTARGQPPSLAEVYEMIVATWAHSSVPPTRKNLDVVIEGVRIFFRRPEFVYEASSLMAQYGFNTEAGALADVGLKVATDEKLKSRFIALKGSAAPAAVPPDPSISPAK